MTQARRCTVATYATAYSGERIAPAGGYTFGNAICPKGTIAVGGGYIAGDVTAPMSATASYPTGMADGRSALYADAKRRHDAAELLRHGVLRAVNAKLVYLG